MSSKGMSQDMYDFIVENMSLFNINEDKGIITTPKGTNGTICTSTGYLRFKFKKRTLQVHQVLAVKYFGELCIGKQINHINGNKTINTKENLEPVTQQENIQHAFENGLEGSTKRISMYSMDGKYIKTFNSVIQASQETNISLNCIYKAARGYQYSRGRKVKANSASGYKWKYTS